MKSTYAQQLAPLELPYGLWNVDTDAITMDERAYELWGVSKDEKNITFEILSQNIHPADLERGESRFGLRVQS